MGMEPAFLVTLPTPLTTTGAAGNPCPFRRQVPWTTTQQP
jgi:hypothetical protein